MSLKKYDEKCVRITDTNGDLFEGYSVFNDKEYNEHEYGRNEDSLQILNIIFYDSFIEKIEEIDSLSDKEYGNLEELIIESGIDFIEDALDYNEEVHNKRIMLCVKDHKDEFNKDELDKLLGGKDE